jgi:hypothetical protein
MIRIDNDLTFAGCEDFIERCQRSKTVSAELKLATNVNLTTRPAGAVSLAQALVTWARRHVRPTLVTYASAAEDLATIDNLTAELHGVAAAMMATEILAVDRSTSLKSNVYESVRRRVVTMNTAPVRQSSYGPSASLVCVDHSTLGYLNRFYHGPEVGNRLRGEGDFLDLTTDLLEACVPEPSRSRIDKDHVSALAAILKELFANTHDHARRDLDGKSLIRSVRGVHARLHQVDPARIAEFTEGLPTLTAYLTDRAALWRGRYLVLAEISVFDSGPGLAAKSLGRRDESISIQDEYDAVSRCFLKHVTSKARASDGLGLYRTLGLLKARSGFLRLRTGRLSLCRAFSPAGNPGGHETLDAGDLQLRDGMTGGAVPTRMPFAEGAVATILLPVGSVAL